MTKREVIDMFKNIIFPKQAEDLLKINYEGLGELDKREYLRDTSTLIMLAEKGLKSEQEIVKPYIEKLKADIEVAYDELDGYEQEALSTFASRIDDLINNMLKEIEEKVE